MKHPTNPCGWWAAYYPTIMSGAVLRMHPDAKSDLEVNASRDGVGGHGPITVTVTDNLTEGFFPDEVVQAAWRVHKALKKDDSGDRYAIICSALGPEWTVDQPAIFTKWPPCPDTE